MPVKQLECGNCYAVSPGRAGDVCPACEEGHLGVWERECERCGERMYYELGWWHDGGDVSCPHDELE